MFSLSYKVVFIPLKAFNEIFVVFLLDSHKNGPKNYKKILGNFFI